MSRHAEQGILGAILQDEKALLKCVKILRPADFEDDAHQRIFASCLDLCERGVAVDLITAADELGRRKELEAVGGAVYLAELVDSVPTAANVAYHAKIVKREAVRRRLIGACARTAKEVQQGGDTYDLAAVLLEELDWIDLELRKTI